MKVNVKLFSVLCEHVPDYNPQRGVEVELKDGATAADLLRQLGIGLAEAPVVTCKGRVLYPEDTIKDNSVIEIFQSVAGG